MATTTVVASTSLSFRTLRTAMLAALAIGLAVFTGGVFVLVNRIFANFGPGVQADLAWKATRGARELAQASELGLAAGDAAMVGAAFDAFRSSEDVVAIVAVDAAGKPVTSFGHSPEAPAALFAGPAGTVRRMPTYYVGWAKAEIEGAEVGRLALVISTRRLVDSERLLRQVETIVGVGGVLGLIVGSLFVIFLTGAIIRRDAQLAEHAATLERKVEERTAELDERNRGMRLVLDNVRQGFITIGLDGVMATERSAIVATWLGAAAEGDTLPDALARHDARVAEWLRLGLAELRERTLPPEVLLDQLPKQVRLGARTLKADYSPLGHGGAVDRLLVVLTDVTAELERELMERRQREMLALFQAVSADRSGFLGFAREAAAMVEVLRLRSASDRDARDVEQRLVHTLKGNASVYRLDALVDACHDAETRMVDEAAALADAHREAIVAAWERIESAVAELVGESGAAMAVDTRDYAALLGLVRAGAGHARLERALRSWQLEPVSLRLERTATQMRQLADRLGKPAPQIHVDAGGLRLDAKRWAPFWSAFVHVARNAVDHGLETPEARARRGQPAHGTLRIAATLDGDEVVVRMDDDGPGVDWGKLAARAARLGLTHDSRAALERALFTDGVTTRERATLVSGRGVGMAAVKAAVDGLGGRIVIRSEANAGTTFEFRVPDGDAFAGPRPDQIADPGFANAVSPSHTGALPT